MKAKKNMNYNGEKIKSKSRVFTLLCSVAAAFFLISGCTSISYIEGLIKKGDKVTAIERLCARLSDNKNDEEAITLFIQIYPSTVEEILPKKDVSQVRRNFADKYNASEINAIKKCLSQISKRSSILYHQDISNVINESVSIINAYDKLIRIQNAVRKIPNTIGNASTGEYQVKKYNDNYQQLKDNAYFGLGEFYFNIAEAMYPGNDIDERKVIISIYKKSSSYSFDTSRIADKLQGLNYEIAIELINQKFKDDQFLTKKDYQEIIGYLEDAGNYKDAKQKIITVKYYLALLYRSENNRKSYEEAGKLFEELGDFGDSYYEAKLYGFYKQIELLGGSSKSGNISLKPGSYNSFKIKKSEINYSNGKSVVDVQNSTSCIDIYSNDYRTVIYPGSIINGETIASQDFTKFKYGSRNSLKYSFSSNGREIYEGLLVNPFDGSACEKEIQNSLTKNANSINPEFTYEFYELNSPEDLKAVTAIGAGRNKVAYANETSRWYPEKSYTLVKVTQKYYSTSVKDMDLPINLFAVDRNVLTLNSVAKLCPYYVSSVDYGRKAYFVITSDLTNEEIINDVKSARPRDSKNTGASGLRVNSEIERKWANNNTLISAITVCDKYYSINDIAGMYSWIKTGTDMAVEVTEIVPISFTLRSVYDNSYAILSQSVEVPFVAQVKPVKVEEPKQTSQSSSNSISEEDEKDRSAAQNQKSDDNKSSGNNNHNGKNNHGNHNENNHTASQPAGNSGNVNNNNNSGKNNSGKNNSGKNKEDKNNDSKNEDKDNKNQNQTSEQSITPETPAAPTSLVFVGKKGTYSCTNITVESGSGVKTLYYDIPANDIENCTASWNTSEYKSVTINGIQMTMKSTVYSFRDVCGNTISLDTVDAKGNRVHNLLLVRKK